MLTKISTIAAIALSAVEASWTPTTYAYCKMAMSNGSYAGGLYMLQGCNVDDPVRFTAKGWRLGRDLEAASVQIFVDDPTDAAFANVAKVDLGTWFAKWGGSFGFVGQYRDDVDVDDSDLVGNYAAFISATPNADGTPNILASCQITQGRNSCPVPPAP